VDSARDAASAVQSVLCVPPLDAVKIAKWVTVTPADAAAEVSAFALAFTDGSALVADAQPVAPIAVRAREPVSDVPFADHAMWSVAPVVGNLASRVAADSAFVSPAMMIAP